MAYKSLAHFIQVLEQSGELVRIKEYVNPHLEITEVTDRISKQYGPALLFENTGYDFPLLINSRKKLIQNDAIHYHGSATPYGFIAVGFCA